MSYLLHESLYRSPAVMERLRGFSVTVCGAGALGANVAESLARSGVGRLRLVDRDRVEEQNLSTQPYHLADVGAQKAKILAGILYRAVGAEADARAVELTAANASSLLDGSDLVLDTFDNSVARGAVRDACLRDSLPCLHAGLSADYAEVIWNERYRVPSAARDDVCDYPLARNLALLCASLASELALRFAAAGERRSLTLTLEDLAVRPFEG